MPDIFFIFFFKYSKLIIGKSAKLFVCGNYVRREAGGGGESESLQTSAICWCKLSSLQPNRHNNYERKIITLKKIEFLTILHLMIFF